ncbi:unnamed protein product [Rotaria sordida]|uniref:Translation elongation factor EF1B beta/delta subunit guanine nucleotide exchange domain-containing protein n=1 Tax=Rotaria sordida TaxID=392033 RepID=A0A814FSF9_9BILA|nr:unnamed protein product [Rotaria sordida]
MLEHLMHVNTWFPKYEVDLAEQTHFNVFGEKPNITTSFIKHEKTEPPKQQEQFFFFCPKEFPNASLSYITFIPICMASLSKQIHDVRKMINQTNPTTITSNEMNMNTEQRLANIETTHKNILQMLDDLKRRVEQLELNKQTICAKPVESKKPAAAADDDLDLFGSDDEEQSEETKKRLAEYATKKSKKEQVIAKSTIVLDVKPWDDETDLGAMEKVVRSIEADGLVWGQSKLLPVAFGCKKLQIGCVVEDDKIGTDFLEEKICAFEDFVQSVDIVAFNKI